VYIVFTQHDLQANSMMFGRREEMIIDFKPRILFRAPIKAAQIGEKLNSIPGAVLSRVQAETMNWRGNYDGRFAQGVNDLA